MTYPFKFRDVEQPQVEFGPWRRWGELSAVMARASAGRHEVGPLAEHRLTFFTGGPVATHCACDGQRQNRLQAPGEFDFIPAGLSGVWEDDEPTEMLSIRLAPALLAAAAEGLELDGVPKMAPRLAVRDAHIAHLARALAAEFQRPSSAGSLYAESLGASLAARLIQGCAREGWSGPQTLSKAQLRRLVDYVETHIDTDLTLFELAAVAGISVPHLTPLFRRSVGRSVHRYVIERRVERARALLLQGDHTVTEAALQAGFSHPSHLASWVKRLLGVTPNRLRAEARSLPTSSQG